MKWRDRLNIAQVDTWSVGISLGKNFVVLIVMVLDEYKTGHFFLCALIQ